METCAQNPYLTKRQKQLLAYGAASLAGAYFAYRIYRSDSLAALTEFRSRLGKGMNGYSKSFLLASQCSTAVMQDIQQFLSSDSDEVPQSLKQLAKLAKNKEVSEATSSLAAAVLQGAFSATRGGAQAKDEDNTEAPSQNLLERVLEMLTTERGTNLVSLAVGMACRSSVQAMYEFGGSRDSNEPGWWQQMLNFGTTPHGERLYSNCVGTLSREAMKVYMGSMEGVNPWEDFLGSLCKPERQATMDRMTRIFVNELIVSCFRRSRHGSTASRNSKVGPLKHGLQAPSAKLTSNPPLPTSDAQSGDGGYVVTIQPKDAQRRVSIEDGTLPDDVQNSSSTPEWAAALAEAAKQPEIRALILSIAGTASAEGVRSSFMATRDLLLGPPSSRAPIALPQHTGGMLTQQMSTRGLGTLLLCVLMPIILFLAGRRAALA